MTATVIMVDADDAYAHFHLPHNIQLNNLKKSRLSSLIYQKRMQHHFLYFYIMHMHIISSIMTAEIIMAANIQADV